MVDVVQVWKEADIKWVTVVTPYERSTGSSSGENTIEDSIFDVSSDATTFTEAIIEVVQDPGEPITTFVYTSLDLDIATVDIAGTVEWVKDGSARISTKGPRATRQNLVPVSAVGGQSTEIFNRFVAGSLAAYTNDFIMTGISGKTNIAQYTDIFSTYDPGADNFIRNIGAWHFGLDLTPLVAYSPNTNSYKPGQMITNQVGINVAHFQYTVGTIVWFVDDSNVLYKRTIDAVTNLTAGNPHTSVNTDISIWRLDEALPVSIVPLKFMPANWLNFQNAALISSAYKDNGLAWVYPTQEKGLFTTDHQFQSSLPTPEYPDAKRFQTTTQKITARKDWFRVGKTGDSGNVGGPIINNKIALHTNYASYSGTGWDLSSLTDLIQIVVTELTPGATIGIYDLAAEGFPTFP